MRTFFIYPNLRKQSAREILPSVCERLRGRDIRLILPNQMRGTMHALHDEVMALDYMDTAEAVRIADAAVVLGGDGTMLRIARAAAQNELPLLGINVGHVGFMTELEPAELDKMQALLEGDYQLDSRMMLHVEVERHGRRVYENDALNDIVIAKGTAFRVVRVGISADGEEVTRFNGDGVIAAMGDHHLRISKSVRDGRSFTDVSPMDRAHRVDEIARLLSGEEISDAARKNAEDLLDAAGQGA